MEVNQLSGARNKVIQVNHKKKNFKPHQSFVYPEKTNKEANITFFNFQSNFNQAI